MKILLDTCTFLWLITDDAKLSSKARACFIDPSNEIFLSSVSTWEMTVKYQAGMLPLPEFPHVLVPKYRLLHRIEALPLLEEDISPLSRLPSYHKDPFDRMLICQSIVQELTILTPDLSIHRYPIRLLW